MNCFTCQCLPSSCSYSVFVVSFLVEILIILLTFHDNFTLNVCTRIFLGGEEIFKREALEKLKSSATFGKMTPLMARLWKSRMKCYHVRKLQPASKYLTHYIFFLRINALLELKAKFCGNKLILKENSK